jgi:hypothetical protein
VSGSRRHSGCPTAAPSRHQPAFSQLVAGSSPARPSHDFNGCGRSSSNQHLSTPVEDGLRLAFLPAWSQRSRPHRPPPISLPRPRADKRRRLEKRPHWGRRRQCSGQMRHRLIRPTICSSRCGVTSCPPSMLTSHGGLAMLSIFCTRAHLSRIRGVQSVLTCLQSCGAHNLCGRTR